MLRAIIRTSTCVRTLIHSMAIIAAIAIIAMSLLTICDIVGRLIGHSIYGIYDLVGILGALAIAGALPITKAVKGHVAIEYFYGRCTRRGRLAMDSISRTLMFVFFILMTTQSIRYGFKFLAAGEVSPTLYLPLFWVPWFFAISCALTAYVTIYHLLRPGCFFMHINERESDI